jgi:predicted phosphohydrolase
MDCGKATHRPLNWDKMKIKSGILVVAGDVSDNLELTVNYLKSLRKYYKKILFVDGNHEHVYKNPRLYTSDYINKKIKDYKNIYYLPREEFIIDRTVFIGACGWWNYSQGKEEKESKKFSKEGKKIFEESIINRSKKDAEELNRKIKKYQRNKDIDEIVIVTHTIPLPKFSRYIATDYNSFFEELKIEDFNKVKRWVFGHVHIRENNVLIKNDGSSEGRDNIKENNINYLINCRGRPDDNLKEPYSVKTSN